MTRSIDLYESNETNHLMEREHFQRFPTKSKKKRKEENTAQLKRKKIILKNTVLTQKPRNMKSN